MRAAFRLIAVCALLSLVGVVAVVGSGSAKVSSTRGSAAAGILSPQRPAFHAAGAFPAHFSFSSSLASYATFLTGSTTVTTTFKVPGLNCAAGDSGIFPGAFMFTSSSFDGGFIIDQCSGGSSFVTGGAFISGAETNFADPVRVGDLIEIDVSMGAGTNVTVKDLNAKRTWTESLSGSDSGAVEEDVGTGGNTTLNGVPLPTSGASTHYTASKVGGAAIGTQSPSKVFLTNNCTIVLAPGALDSTKTAFAVAAPKVDITNLTPTSGTTGTNVEIDGFGFNSSTKVKFGNVAATTVSHDSATVLHATVPNTAITGLVSVQNTTAPVGNITSPCTFSVAPTITSFTPHSGITGSTVTIAGTGLKPGAKVTFGTKNAKVTSSSATQLKVTVPNGAVPAPITVTTPAGTASTGATNFTPTLSITSFSPKTGPVGTVVTINGRGFNSSSAVKLNGTTATTVTHVSATRLKATVPAGATTGPITVTNTAAPVGTVRSAINYTVS